MFEARSSPGLIHLREDWYLVDAEGQIGWFAGRKLENEKAAPSCDVATAVETDCGGVEWFYRLLLLEFR